MNARNTVRTVALLAIIALVAGCSGPEDKKMKFFNKGQTLFEKGDYTKARLEFRNALQIDPKFDRAHYMLGMVELKEKNLQRAFGALSKAVELNTDFYDAQVALGNVLLMGQEKAAISSNK